MAKATWVLAKCQLCDEQEPVLVSKWVTRNDGKRLPDLKDQPCEKCHSEASLIPIKYLGSNNAGSSGQGSPTHPDPGVGLGAADSRSSSTSRPGQGTEADNRVVQGPETMAAPRASTGHPRKFDEDIGGLERKQADVTTHPPSGTVGKPSSVAPAPRRSDPGPAASPIDERTPAPKKATQATAPSERVQQAPVATERRPAQVPGPSQGDQKRPTGDERRDPKGPKRPIAEHPETPRKEQVTSAGDAGAGREEQDTTPAVGSEAKDGSSRVPERPGLLGLGRFFPGRKGSSPTRRPSVPPGPVSVDPAERPVAQGRMGSSEHEAAADGEAEDRDAANLLPPRLVFEKETGQGSDPPAPTAPSIGPAVLVEELSGRIEKGLESWLSSARLSALVAEQVQAQTDKRIAELLVQEGIVALVSRQVRTETEARLHHLEALLRDLPELFHSFEVELQFWEKGEELDAGEHAAREVVRGTLHKIAKRFATWREDHGLATVPDRADTVPYQETWHRLVGTVATHDPQLADAIHSVQRAGYTYRGERLRKADVIVWRRPREDPAPVPSSAPEGPEAANEDLGGPADGQPDRPIE